MIFRGKRWENWNWSLHIYWWRRCCYGHVQHWWGILVTPYTLFQLQSQLLVLLVIKLHISPCKYSPFVLSLRHRWTLLMRKSGHFILAQRTPFLRNTMAGMCTVLFLFILHYYPFSLSVFDVGCTFHFTMKIQRHLPGSVWSQLEIKVWSCWNMVSRLDNSLSSLCLVYVTLWLRTM